MTTHRALRAGSLLCLALSMPSAGCGEPSPSSPDAGTADSGPGAPDAGADAELPLVPGAVRYDLPAARSVDFFAFPWPSDLRLNVRGAPDLSSFTATGGIASIFNGAVACVEEGSPGFSPLSAVYFSFGASLDPETLPRDAAESVAESASVYLVDVTPSSPTYGERHPATLVYNDAGGGYWPSRTLAIHTLYGIPLRTATSYAAVVTGAVLDATGAPLRAPSLLRDLAGALGAGDPAPAEVEVLRPLVDLFVARGEDPRTIVAATVFTTSDPSAELALLRAWMHAELSPPRAGELTRIEQNDGYSVYEGTFDSVELFSGTSPYRRFGDGRIQLDADGSPASVTPVALSFALSVPDGAMPVGGWPIVLYGHGLGEDHRGFLRVAAAELASRGVAVLGLDPPLQGARNPTSETDQDLIVGLAVSNIVIGREIIRQGVFDEMRAAALVSSGLSIPAAVATGGVAIDFDRTRVAFLGHSEGAQIGALLAPLEPTIGAHAFSAGGGGAAITMLELDTGGIDVARMVASAVGIDESVETFDLDHPVTTILIQPLLDVADPLHYARGILREPIADRPHDLLMTEGFNDLLTPPASTEALASALGLPIAEPVGRPIPASDLQGVGSVALPAEANLPEVGGRRASAALLQLPSEDHYAIYRNAVVRGQIFEFLRSALAGSAVIPPP